MHTVHLSVFLKKLDLKKNKVKILFVMPQEQYKHLVKKILSEAFIIHAWKG